MKHDDSGNEPFIGYYVVGFFDLLGQQERLRSLRCLPDTTNKEQMESFKQTLRETYGAVSCFRESFQGFFTSFSKPAVDTSRGTDNQRQAFGKLTSNPIEIRSFSDSTIVSLALRADEAKLPIRGIYGILGAAASSSLLLLAAGNPIRGGIEIGLGMEIEKREIYGSCLARAVRLESKIAKYPRVVIGKELLLNIKFTSQQAPQDDCARIGIGMAKDCLDLLCLDADGNAIIDYLGESFKQKIGTSIGKKDVEKAYEYVIKSHDKFRVEDNTKLVSRYTSLKNYFDERLPIWEK